MIEEVNFCHNSNEAHNNDKLRKNQLSVKLKSCFGPDKVSMQSFCGGDFCVVLRSLARGCKRDNRPLSVFFKFRM